MDVADLDDSVAVEGLGKAVDLDGAGDDLDVVAVDHAGVDGKASGDGTGTGEEVAASDSQGGSWYLIGGITGHTS